MPFSNYNNDLDILTRKMNSLMNTNLVEKDAQIHLIILIY